MAQSIDWPAHQPAYVPPGSGTQAVRIRRVKGKVLQDCDVYAGREQKRGGWNLSKSKWANPFPVGNDRDECLKKYKQYVKKNPKLIADLRELYGKRIGCWCKPQKCHVDILIELMKEHHPDLAQNAPN